MVGYSVSRYLCLNVNVENSLAINQEPRWKLRYLPTGFKNPRSLSSIDSFLAQRNIQISERESGARDNGGVGG